MDKELRKAVVDAGRRIRPYVRRTPLDESLALSRMGDDQVFLKLENWQHTGSFKLRGAFNKLLQLTPAELQRGVVVASSGNHGAAVAYALRKLGATGVVFAPTHAAATKLEAIQRLGAAVQLHGEDSVDAEHAARAHAAEHGLPYISPYNDWAIVAGQGTVGLEIVRDQPDVDTIYVTVGGGGLIGGIAGYVKQRRTAKPVRIVGCLPAHSPVMAESVRAGHVVEMESLPTLADGSAGGIESDAITFALCQALVDDWILVDEDEIAAAIRLIAETHHQIIEGAAGVAVAAYLKDVQRGQGRKVAIVLCGANIDLRVLKSIL
ncbi:MAG: serine/threonine dehydratase [Chloroflexota bacterium]|nr:threonine/serine dehydratase [Caldilinea sp.]GIK75778.1 MAG: serine/threonine dehydratase [Chloroflexota bacterium]